MGFGYDPEVPAGFQDADIEQAELEEAAARAAALEREGKCTHGHRQNYHPEYAPELSPGEARCYKCGKVAPASELDDEREALGFGRMNFED